MEIVDNFVNTVFQDDVLDKIINNQFSWNYSKCGTQTEYDKRYHFVDDNTIDSSQFTHNLIEDSYITKYLLHYIEDYFGRNFSDRLLRVKVNMLLKDSTYKFNNYHIPHSDYTQESESVIYYVNDSDGDTFIFNEKPDINLTKITIRDRISPVKGRALLFDSSYLHASSSPVISSERIIINFVFKK
ncbi:Oxoglutarate/iron-dependent dioxygenase [uncultured Caudovirales phage]|uniref:Oxoglutarate/iron-dependent dioxygenase n=1 Tax=uncultured Caudovirales phage TaxID=2100421 RepID=A0A6J7WY81_9CAUD|nr:Oxoglutarate/iron-dependent dioxygenase [uncultured Caudovirales phage]